MRRHEYIAAGFGKQINRGQNPLKIARWFLFFYRGHIKKDGRRHRSFEHMKPFLRCLTLCAAAPTALVRRGRRGGGGGGVRFCKSPMKAASPKAQPLSAEAVNAACSCAPTPACTRAAEAASRANGVLPSAQYNAWGVSSRSLRKPRQWAWLDQGESAACATSAARTGFRSMYTMQGSR